MPDELDPVLEARLRTAFRSSEDPSPLPFSADDVLAERGRRRMRRIARGGGVLAAAIAVVAVGLVVVPGITRRDEAAPPAGVGTLTTPTTAPSGRAAADFGEQAATLASYGQLTVLLPPALGRTIHGQRVDAGTPVRQELAPVGAGSPIWYALSCGADKVTVSFDTGDGSPDTMDLACGRAPVSGSLTWEAGPAKVSVSAADDTAWRLVLAPGTGSHRELAEPIELKQLAQLNRTTGGVTLAAGEGPDPTLAGLVQATDLGVVGSQSDVEIAIDCVGGDIEIRAMSGETVLAGYRGPCEPAAHVIWLTIRQPAPDTRLVVNAPGGVQWRLLAVGPVPASAAP